MSPELMRSRANEYRNEASTVDGVINKMDQLLAQLQSEWDGDSSESYAARYEELRPSFVNAYDLINEIAAALDKAAQITEETDRNIASAFRA